MTGPLPPEDTPEMDIQPNLSTTATPGVEVTGR